MKPPVRITGLWVEIWNWKLPNTKQEPNHSSAYDFTFVNYLLFHSIKICFKETECGFMNLVKAVTTEVRGGSWHHNNVMNCC
jgi:hypothetical protein